MLQGTAIPLPSNEPSRAKQRVFERVRRILFRVYTVHMRISDDVLSGKDVDLRLT